MNHSLRHRRVTRTGGAALLDLMIVAIIIGILGVVAIPLFSSVISDNKLDGSAGELVAALQYAGNLAVRYQRPFALSADVTGNWFKVYDTNPQPNNEPPVDANGVVVNPFDKTSYLKDFDTMDQFQGARILSVPSGGVVQFFPDGHSGNTDSVFIVSYGGKQRTITVNGTTGLITVQ